MSDAQQAPAVSARRCQTVTPYLVVDDVGAALELYARAFGTEALVRLEAPGGGPVIYAELCLGNSKICVVSAEQRAKQPERSPKALGGVSGMLWLYVRDADALFQQALAAGCTELTPMTDMFWGDRMGKLVDPFGQVWAIAQQVKVMTPEEVAEAARQLAAH